MVDKIINSFLSSLDAFIKLSGVSPEDLSQQKEHAKALIEQHRNEIASGALGISELLLLASRAISKEKGETKRPAEKSPSLSSSKGPISRDKNENAESLSPPSEAQKRLRTSQGEELNAEERSNFENQMPSIDAQIICTGRINIEEAEKAPAAEEKRETPLQPSQSGAQKQQEQQQEKDIEQPAGQGKQQTSSVAAPPATNETSELGLDPGILSAFPRISDRSPDYTNLASLVNDAETVDIYVVAVEMIRASVRSTIGQRDIINYRAVDPSICTPNGQFTVDVSIQIVANSNQQHHHVGFGDILRLKRVSVKQVHDKSGKRFVNVILSHKHKPSIRLWDYNKNHSLDECQDDFKKKEEIIKDEAHVIYFGQKTNVLSSDVQNVAKLKAWSKSLDPMKIVNNSEYTKQIAHACLESFDGIVCILEVEPEDDVNLAVSDASGYALINGFNEILTANLMCSDNKLKPNDWIKIRCINKASEPYIRSDGTSWTLLTSSSLTCVTRLPELNLPFAKPGPQRSIKLAMPSIDVWNATSMLNPDFPKRLEKRTGYVQRALMFASPQTTFSSIVSATQSIQKGTTSQPEEGEIF